MSRTHTTSAHQEDREQGDVDHPHHLCGHWGKPEGEAEVPEPARGLGKADAPRVRAFETGRFLLSFDDREGQEALVVKDKTSGDQLEFDGKGMGITVKATSALLLRADGMARIAAAATRAAELGNVQLATIVDCANANIEAQMKNLGESAAPVNRLIGVINLFVELAGLPKLPDLSAPWPAANTPRARSPGGPSSDRCSTYCATRRTTPCFRSLPASTWSTPSNAGSRASR